MIVAASGGHDAGRGGQRQEDDQTNKDGKRPGPPWARDHVRRRVSAKKTSSRVTGLPSAPSTDAVRLAGGSTARNRPGSMMATRPQRRSASAMSCVVSRTV